MLILTWVLSQLFFCASKEARYSAFQTLQTENIVDRLNVYCQNTMQFDYSAINMIQQDPTGITPYSILATGVLNGLHENAGEFSISVHVSGAGIDEQSAEADLLERVQETIEKELGTQC